MLKAIELAEASGVGQSVISRLLNNGKQIGTSNIYRILSALEILKPESIALVSNGEFSLIPKAIASASAGDGFTVVEDGVEDRLYAFRTDWLKGLHVSIQNLIMVDVTGDSMERILFDGDSTLVDRNQKEIIDGKIYWIGYGDENYMKYLFRRPGDMLSVKSENPQHEPFPARIDEIRIIGRVVWGARVF